MTLPLRIESRGHSGIAVIGELDSTTVHLLDEALQAYPARPIRIDLSECRYIDSLGVDRLLRAHIELPDRVTLVAPSVAVQRVLDIAGLNRYFVIDRAPTGEGTP